MAEGGGWSARCASIRCVTPPAGSAPSVEPKTTARASSAICRTAGGAAWSRRTSREVSEVPACLCNCCAFAAGLLARDCEATPTVPPSPVHGSAAQASQVNSTAWSQTPTPGRPFDRVSGSGGYGTGNVPAGQTGIMATACTTSSPEGSYFPELNSRKIRFFRSCAGCTFHPVETLRPTSHEALVALCVPRACPTWAEPAVAAGVPQRVGAAAGTGACADPDPG